MGERSEADERFELMAFGDRLRELREDRKMSQMDLGNAAGLHFTYVSGIERGRRNVSLLKLCALARALDLDARELLPVGFPGPVFAPAARP